MLLCILLCLWSYCISSLAPTTILELFSAIIGAVVSKCAFCLILTNMVLLYVAHVVTAAAHEKSLRRPRTAVEAIHDFVELQGSDDTVRSTNAATQGFRHNFSRVVLTKRGELKASHRDALERQRRMMITGSWPAVAGLLRCPSEPTILHTFSRANLTAAAPTPFHMCQSCYSL